MGRPKLFISNSSDTDLSAQLDSRPMDSSLVGQASLDWRGTTSSGYARPGTAPAGRGPNYLGGASHGNTLLAKPPVAFEFQRPGGVDFWHSERQPSPHIFNLKAHKYTWGADRPITGPELSDGAVDSTKPLDVLKRRNSVTKRPIAIVSGTHGRPSGNNWEESTGERIPEILYKSFLSEDIVRHLGGSFVPNTRGATEGPANGGLTGPEVSGDLSGYTFIPGSKGRPGYYISSSATKKSFESRIRIYDAKDLTEEDHRRLIADKGKHVILGYCYSRNDESFRYRGPSAPPVPPVTSYHSKETLPLRKPLIAPAGTMVTVGPHPESVPTGARIENDPDEYLGLIITPLGEGASKSYGSGVKLWFPDPR
ncbi:hypothetical protein [Pseudomonas chlororaphis]|uniref:hypothetical protein n=1 Tax=Pseudomonas chlororaphis TaxID=587753 RepID=UPI0009C07F4E